LKVSISGLWRKGCGDRTGCSKADLNDLIDVAEALPAVLSGLSLVGVCGSEGSRNKSKWLLEAKKAIIRTAVK
jgi:hypothetical protein